MTPEILVLSLALVLGAVFAWGFRVLPKERWQILASAPVKKHGDHWTGANYTFYGFFTATAQVAALSALIFLLGSASLPPAKIAFFALALLMVALPSARILARIVEKKKNTFTVGGAVFTAMLTAPAVVWASTLLFPGPDPGPMAYLAALTVSYALGESLGRLACISFGCCYGKPLSQCPPLVARLFSGLCFIFTGATKKIAYAHNLDSCRVFPVQAVTSIIYTISGLMGIYLFLNAYYSAAFLQSLAVTQLWRGASEFLRADYRGEGRISAYQYMAVFCTLFGVALFFFFNPAGAAPLMPDMRSGFFMLWRPETILALQLSWACVFIYTGRSKVTGSTLSFHVNKECI